MPNTEVKLFSADDSWGLSPCESRTLPGQLFYVDRKRNEAKEPKRFDADRRPVDCTLLHASDWGEARRSRNRAERRWSVQRYVTKGTRRRSRRDSMLIANQRLFHRSSVVEQSAVNRWVVGSNPTGGAISASLAQLVERIHGKDEVTGSSPVGSSILNSYRQGPFWDPAFFYSFSSV